MALASSFSYTSIDSSLGDIRVLNIYPGDQADNLILTFDVVRILDDSELDFEAISYRWGSPEGGHSALLNGWIFTITSSQDQMLRNLRDPQNIRRVWIDALCINQQDIRERNDQIQLLRDIFRYAQCVCVYLDYEILENGFAYIKFLTFTSVCKVEELLEEKTYLWQQICDALLSEYFYRVWVQQEISLARRLALQCRRTPLPKNCLLHFLKTWDHISLLQTTGDLEFDIKPPLSNVPSSGILNILRGYRNPFTEGPLDLIELLRRSTQFKCTDDRDRIYGVMFLADSWQREYLIADYSLTVSDVFREAMISYLENFGSISFLEHANFCYKGYDNIKDRTPSWAPDWRKSPLKSGIDGHVPEIKRNGNYPRVARVLGNILCTTGIKITMVQKYYDNMLSSDIILSMPVREFWAVFNDIVQNATHPANIESRSHHLAWLLVDRGEVSALDSDDEDAIHAFRKFVPFFDSFLQSAGYDVLPAFSDQLNNLRAYLWASGNRGNTDHRLMFTFLNKLAFCQLSSLRPFISQTGSIGLAPPYTQPGDELWLIPTCKHPIVLRPHGGKHIVLGYSWLDNEKIWEPCGGVRDFLTVGDEFGSYKVQPLLLE